ncbi:hypothetical protein N7467_004977 [Penicillium canescens]|nr:hypothetical protein N7467_004977 [Penicillium canescens]
MNSWLGSNHAADEQPLSNHYPGWSSTAASPSNQQSPGRREHAVQPPLLTTALSGPQYQGLGAGLGLTPTPLSSTSLSSPFTHGQSPCVPSSINGRSVSSSSMASRNAYNVPYNPQDWGPPGRPSAQGYLQPGSMHRVTPQRNNNPDVPVSPPPPPYSPPSNQNRVPQDFAGPANPHYAANPSPPNTREGDFDMPVQYQRRSNRPRPLSMVYPSNADAHRQSLPPPPPPQGHPASRSVSQNRSEYQGVPYNVTSNHRPRLSHYDQGYNEQISVTPAHLETPSRPPASRRAASAGAVPSSAGSSRAGSQTRNRSPSTNNNWEPGMPLPPPPPGPPPTTRSVSVSGSSESSMRTPQGSVGRTRRAPPVLGTGLGSIPPTPADWIDEGYLNSRPTEPLYVDTAKAAKAPEPSETDPHNTANQRTPGSGGLFRSSAIRDPSAKGIRERRIERRNRQSQVYEDVTSAVSTSGNPWADALEQIKPSNLILPDQNTSPDQTQHPKSSRYTPRSTRSIGSEGQRTASRSRAGSTGLFSDQSSYGTPRQEPSSAGVGPSAAFAHTPPFSPNGEGSSGYPKEASQVIPPKALPTPPLNSGKEVRPRSRAPSRGAEDRPISHILHMPNDAVSMMKPLSPRRTPGQQTQQASMEAIIKQDPTFLQDAMERHKGFIEKESSAVDETEALKTFVDYILAESQIRRQRYAKVWESFQVDDVRRNLFEMPVIQPSKAKPQPKLDIPSNRAGRPESAWWNNYQPCLSPIASLNMSNDEMSSRGRAPSRWWESKTGSSSEGGERRVQRSKRESKYMGLPREAMQWDQELTPSQPKDVSMNYGTTEYGPDEYPPEKVGWHEDSPANSTSSGHQYSETRRLDVSRLITLPPPYPRHHPAVNNSHPDLVTHRTTVRSITDLTEIKTTRHRYKADVERMLQEHQVQVDEGHRHFKSNIQSQIQEGSLTFAEAAEAEAAMIVEENERERAMVKRQLDTYQEIVLKPIHVILADRISRATACIDKLSSMLFDDAQRDTPDSTQEEGDEKPELLEKLTQLKWLFEARELLHRELFDLVSDRDDKYKAVALLPYKQNKNEDKLRETQAFFSQDALDRRVEYENEALSRLESFLNVIEQNVVRGVEVQLSAFWDIAPSLLALVQQVPEDLHGFQVQIPADEYDENPSYHSHPLQYLYTLLSHAEKSSYQFIESQTNLLCLLHEVRSAVMRANRNLLEAERIKRGETEEDVRREMEMTRADEELALTTDLKDKVATVEGQWTEALGSQIEGLRERVKEQLVSEDGWEELEQLEE